jgi:hypothetical protein
MEDNKELFDKIFDAIKRDKKVGGLPSTRLIKKVYSFEIDARQEIHFLTEDTAFRVKHEAKRAKKIIKMDNDHFIINYPATGVGASDSEYYILVTY